MSMIVKTPYFKLRANNITFFILGEFFWEKIKSNIKVDVPFFHFLIRKASSINKVNIANGNKNMSATISLATKSKKDH